MPLSPLKSIANLLAKTASKEIPTVAEQSTGALTKVAAPNLSRRNFLKQTAGMAARQAVPDAVMDALVPASVRMAETAVPRTVARAVANEAASSGTDLASALAAVNARIKAHNALAMKQAEARAEAGIPDLIEGHQPVLSTLKRNSALIPGETELTPLASLVRKMQPPLTKEQKAANKLYEKQFDEQWNSFSSELDNYIQANPLSLEQAAEKYPYIKHLINNNVSEDTVRNYANMLYKDDLEKNLKGLNRPVYKPPHVKFDPENVGEYLTKATENLQFRKLKTGWDDISELETAYVPGIGHAVTPLENGAQSNITYWLKSPEKELHDDVILQEYLNSMWE